MKLPGWIKEHLQSQLGYSTAVRYLHEHDYHLKVPVPGRSNTMRPSARRSAKSFNSGKTIQASTCGSLMESGFEGHPLQRRTWTKIGQVRHSPYLGEHIRHNVFDPVRPKDGRLGALLLNLCDSVTFQVFLDTLAEENPAVAGRRAILVLNNASWHKIKSLNWHHFEPEYLPPRSPDLNAIERLWLRMKAGRFNGWTANPSDQLQDRLIEALRSLLDHPDIVRSQCRPKTCLLHSF